MGTEHQLTSTLHSLQTTTMVDASNTNGSNGVVTDIVVNNDHPVDTSPSPNGKIPSSITRVYDIPVVKGTVDYADSLIRSLPLAGAAYVKAESIASTVYKKAGEPLQEKLQPQIAQLDGLANKTLDYVQGKAPFLFEAKPDELVANAKKPADQAYSTAKTYQDLVYNRLHETLLNSQKTLSGLQERLAGVVGSATATIPKNSEEINKLASQLYESLEGVKEAVLKQSHDLPAHVSKTVQPYVEKLQKGASDVSAELAKKDVPIHAKAQKIIGITKEISSESLHDAIEALRAVINNNKKQVEGAKENGKNGAESAQEFVQEHTPGDVSYAQAVKE